VKRRKKRVYTGILRAQTKIGYLDSLASKVLDNIQLFLDNVHVRYEDSDSHPERPFSFGFTLNCLHMQSTDDKWVPTFDFDSTTKEIMYKVGYSL
jgi:vacuolar protein sorting-associated protein 13A/C